MSESAEDIVDLIIFALDEPYQKHNLVNGELSYFALRNAVNDAKVLAAELKKTLPGMDEEG